MDSPSPVEETTTPVVQSAFGGGITATNLKKIAFALIAGDSKSDNDHVKLVNTSSKPLRYNKKGWHGFSARTNTVTNYTDIQLQLGKNLQQIMDTISEADSYYSEGGLVVEVVSPILGNSLLKGDIVVSVDGTIVGPYGTQFSIGDITFYKVVGEVIKLIIRRITETIEVEIKLLDFPDWLDVPYGITQGTIKPSSKLDDEDLHVLAKIRIGMVNEELAYPTIYSRYPSDPTIQLGLPFQYRHYMFSSKYYQEVLSKPDSFGFPNPEILVLVLFADHEREKIASWLRTELEILKWNQFQRNITFPINQGLITNAFKTAYVNIAQCKQSVYNYCTQVDRYVDEKNLVKAEESFSKAKEFESNAIKIHLDSQKEYKSMTVKESTAWDKLMARVNSDNRKNMQIAVKTVMADVKKKTDANGRTKDVVYIAESGLRERYYKSCLELDYQEIRQLADVYIKTSTRSIRESMGPSLDDIKEIKKMTTNADVKMKTLGGAVNKPVWKAFPTSWVDGKFEYSSIE